VGALSVTWVLDERDVVGDNNRDLGLYALNAGVVS
jgi:hypothetical protein